jgi:hypothetical protein
MWRNWLDRRNSLRIAVQVCCDERLLFAVSVIDWALAKLCMSIRSLVSRGLMCLIYIDNDGEV